MALCGDFRRNTNDDANDDVDVNNNGFKVCPNAGRHCTQENMSHNMRRVQVFVVGLTYTNGRIKTVRRGCKLFNSIEFTLKQIIPITYYILHHSLVCGSDGKIEQPANTIEIENPPPTDMWGWLIFVFSEQHRCESRVYIHIGNVSCHVVHVSLHKHRNIVTKSNRNGCATRCERTSSELR